MSTKMRNRQLFSDDEETLSSSGDESSTRLIPPVQSIRRGLPQQVQIRMLPVDEVDFDPQNPRSGELPDIEKLAASIRSKGLLQPIGVVAEGERYSCRFGNRRLAAYKLLANDAALPADERIRFQNIPALTVSVGSGEEEAILSNTQIVALSAEDKARAFQKLHDMGYNDSDIGELFNLRRQTVNSYRNNQEALASGMTIFAVQHPGRRRQSAEDGVTDNRTAKNTTAYWATALIERAAKGKLQPPTSAEQKGKLLELRTLIDMMLGEKV